MPLVAVVNLDSRLEVRKVAVLLLKTIACSLRYVTATPPN